MTSRDQRRSQAQATARTRRIQEAARRDEELRAQGVDPLAVERARLAPTQSERSRRRFPLKIVLLVGVGLLLVIGIVGGILLWQRISAFNDSVSTAPATSSALWGPLGGKDRVNVVLFGYGGVEHKGGNFLADSIQILSIDPVTDTTTVIPIPRDLWVEGNPQIPNNAKINEAFADGYDAGGLADAGAFAAEVLSGVTGLDVKYWMAIDFTGFKEVIDAVGGVTVNNPRAFSYTWSESAFHAGRFNAGSFKRGVLHLDGDQALTYARVRYTSKAVESSDFARSIRQQRVLRALRDKIGSGGIGSIGPGLALMDALKGKMLTNLSAIDLALLSSHITPDRRIELKEGKILEATTNTLGQYILVVIGRQSSTDYQPLKDYIARALARPVRTATPSPSSAGSP